MQGEVGRDAQSRTDAPVMQRCTASPLCHAPVMPCIPYKDKRLYKKTPKTRNTFVTASAASSSLPMPKSLAPRAAPILVKMGPHASAAYDPVKVLGRGAFGTAFAVRSRQDGRMMVRGRSKKC
jgi:hypothetical protein